MPGTAEAAAYRRGLSIMFIATLFTSIAGVVLRLVEDADGWQVLFYRSAALVLTLLPFIVWRYGAGAGAAFPGGRARRAVGGGLPGRRVLAVHLRAS